MVWWANLWNTSCIIVVWGVDLVGCCGGLVSAVLVLWVRVVGVVGKPTDLRHLLMLRACACLVVSSSGIGAWCLAENGILNKSFPWQASLN